MKAFLPVILIAAAIGLFFFQVNSQYTDVKILRAQAVELDNALKIAEELKQVRGELSKTLDSFSPTDLERLERFLPRNLDTVRIILDVDGIADRNSVRLTNLKVTDSNGGTRTTAGAVPRSVAQSAKAPAYNTVEVSFNFTASYAAGVNFIKDLQTSLRLLDTTNLTVRPSGTNPNNYDFDMKMQTYWIDR